MDEERERVKSAQDEQDVEAHRTKAAMDESEPTDPGRNGPWRGDDVSLSRYDECQCHYQRQCRLGEERWCLPTIGLDDVIEAIDRRMAAAAREGGR